MSGIITNPMPRLSLSLKRKSKSKMLNHNIEETMPKKRRSTEKKSNSVESTPKKQMRITNYYISPDKIETNTMAQETMSHDVKRKRSLNFDSNEENINVIDLSSSSIEIIEIPDSQDSKSNIEEMNNSLNCSSISSQKSVEILEERDAPPIQERKVMEKSVKETIRSKKSPKSKISLKKITLKSSNKLLTKEALMHNNQSEAKGKVLEQNDKTSSTRILFLKSIQERASKLPKEETSGVKKIDTNNGARASSSSTLLTKEGQITPVKKMQTERFKDESETTNTPNNPEGDTSVSLLSDNNLVRIKVIENKKNLRHEIALSNETTLSIKSKKPDDKNSTVERDVLFNNKEISVKKFTIMKDITSTSSSELNTDTPSPKKSRKLSPTKSVTPKKGNLSKQGDDTFLTPNKSVSKNKSTPSPRKDRSVSPQLNISPGENVKFSPKIQRRPGRFFDNESMPAELLKTPVKLASPMKNITPRKRNLMNDFEQSSSQKKIDSYFTSPLGKSKDCFNTRPLTSKIINFDCGINVGASTSTGSQSQSISHSNVASMNEPLTSKASQPLLNEPYSSMTTPKLPEPVKLTPSKKNVPPQSNYDHMLNDGFDWNAALELMNDTQKMEKLVKEAPSIDVNDIVSTVKSPKKSPRKNKPSLDPKKKSDTFIHYLMSNPMIKTEKAKKIFSHYEDKLKIFNSLSDGCQLLYAKHLFTRTLTWYRVEDLEKKYNQDFDDIKGIIATLLTNKLITDDLKTIELKDVLKLLKVNELKLICKHFNVNVDGNGMKKDNLLQALLNHACKQKTMFGNLSTKIKDRAIKELGQCIRLNESFKQFFNLLVITATYPYYMDEEKKRMTDLILRLNQIKWRTITFPAYVFRPDIAFQNLNHLIEYAEALTFVAEYSNYCENKDWEAASRKVIECKDKFSNFLNKDENDDLITSLDGHLIKFTAGYQYAYCLSDGITVLKKDLKDIDNTDECIEVITILLSQNKYLQKKRGVWYEELALVLQNKKKALEDACQAVLQGLQDTKVDLIRKKILSQRASALVKRKTGYIPDGVRAQLREHIIRDSFQPRRDTITARSHEGVAGRKQIFYIETTNGEKTYASVEEIVLDYYQKTADITYEKGMHDEGKTLMNLILGCFYDVIYSHPEGPSVFHCEMQSHPLDWGGIHFYRRRQQLIEGVLSDMRQGGLNGIMGKLENLCSTSENVQSIVSWDYVKTEKLPKIRELIECLGVEVFLKMAEHVIKDYRMYHSGFPDLIMWDPPTKKCLIVEVKGPNDKLSPTQTMWLENLTNFGADARVCHVENVGTRKRKIT